MSDIRRGDVWEFTTNSGVIVRRVQSVACGVVSYVNNGVFRQCALITFKKWARGAELTSRFETTDSGLIIKGAGRRTGSKCH